MLGDAVSRKDSFTQSAFPGMLKGAPLGIVSKGNREESAPSNLTSELRQGNRPMFMTGPEIKENYKPNYWDKAPTESDDDLWSRKLQEAKRGAARNTNEIVANNVANGWEEEPTLAESVVKEGVRNPIFLKEFSKTREVWNGHHRVAIASELRPNMLLPVEHGV
jgi:hypothetical protein